LQKSSFLRNIANKLKEYLKSNYNFDVICVKKDKVFLFEKEKEIFLKLCLEKNQRLNFFLFSADVDNPKLLNQELQKFISTIEKENLTKDIAKETYHLIFEKEKLSNEEENISTLPTFYVDGSFVEGKTRFSYVLTVNNEIILKESGEAPEQYAQSRQVGGELYAVIKSLEKAKQLNYNEIIIAYDYEGIKKWVTEEWKSKIPLTKEYVKIVGSFNIKINWKKIKAHSGDYFNSIADKLARGK